MAFCSRTKPARQNRNESVWGRGENEVGGNLLKKKSVCNNLIQFFFCFHSCIETNKAIVYSINFQKIPRFVAQQIVTSDLSRQHRSFINTTKSRGTTTAQSWARWGPFFLSFYLSVSLLSKIISFKLFLTWEKKKNKKMRSANVTSTVHKKHKNNWIFWKPHWFSPHVKR